MATHSAGSNPLAYPDGYPGKGQVHGRVMSEIMSGGILFSHFEVDSPILLPEHEVGLRSLGRVFHKWMFGRVGRIVGRASQTGPEKRNKRLSQDRADAVRSYLGRYGVREDQLGPAISAGSGEPLQDRPGAEVGVNRSVLVEYELPSRALGGNREPKPRPNGSDYWALRLKIAGTGGHGRIGGAVVAGELMNLKANECVGGYLAVGGLGGGAQTQGQSPPSGRWQAFYTGQALEFDDFHNAFVFVTISGGSAWVHGWSTVTVRFPWLMKPGQDALEFTAEVKGAVGLDLSVNLGVWRLLSKKSYPCGE